MAVKDLTPPKGYSYIYPGKNKPDDDVLVKNYTLKELELQPVVKCADRKYRVFRNWREFWKYNDSIPKESRQFDEIIFGETPQHLKFDIDIYRDKFTSIENSIIENFSNCKFSNIDEKIDAFIAGFIELVLTELSATWYQHERIAPSNEDIIVTDSSGNTGSAGNAGNARYKYSYHIIVSTYAVANNEESKGFTLQVINQLPDELKRFVDPNVNKSTQNFRLVGSSKPDSDRYKEITTKFNTANLSREFTTITARPETRVLKKIFTSKVEKADINLQDEDIKKVLDLVTTSISCDAHVFNQVRDRLFIFHRIRPSFCELCDRVHDKDNSLMIFIEPQQNDQSLDSEIFKVIERCRRNTTAARELGYVSLTRQTQIDLTDALISSDIIESFVDKINNNQIDVHNYNSTALETLHDANIYDEPKMRPYEVTPTLVVKGQMKLGKTKALRAYLDENFKDDYSVIRMVTFRQAFSNSMHQSAFKDFELYSNHKGELDHINFPKLIVQLESLWRIPMGFNPEPIDLLILDEVESILSQFNSGLHRNFNASFAMFQWMMATAKHVICIDANVGDRTFNILKRIRPDHNIKFHWNKFQSAKDDKFQFTLNRAIWLDELFKRLDLDQKIVIPTNSLAEASSCEASIKLRFPNKSVKIYSSKTTYSEKEQHFSDVHTYWSDLDVLIYTPTVSAGVSYELDHFDVLFGYFSDSSCDVETCRQMLARVRNIKNKEYIICLKGISNNLPTSTESIKKYIFNSRNRLYHPLDNMEQLAVQFEYNYDGSIVYLESPYFSLWLETIRMINLSKNAFISRFIGQIADTGAQISVIKSDVNVDNIKLEQYLIKKFLAEEEQISIASAVDLDLEEYTELKERLAANNQDINQDEFKALAKYKLRETYSWYDEITPEFVAKYSPQSTMRVYKNLNRIMSKATIIESLKEIQRMEMSIHSEIMSERESASEFKYSGIESKDLHRKYVFSQHFYAINLLFCIGFKCIMDKNKIDFNIAYQKLVEHENQIMSYLYNIAFEYKIRTPLKDDLWIRERDVNEYLKKLLKFTNTILRKMYGLEVKFQNNQLFINYTSIIKKFDIVKHTDVVNVNKDKVKPVIISYLENEIDDNDLNQFIDNLQ